MADYIGSNGAVNVGSAVGQVTSFSISQSSAIQDNTVMGSEWKDSRPGIKEWSGQMEVLWDPSDAGQNALGIGEMVDSAQFLPQGSGSGGTQYSGNIVVSSVELPVSVGELIKQSISFTGRGPLVESIIA